MQRKTVLITGGNSGIGLATAQEMAARGIRVCLACRNQQKAADAADAIRAKIPGAEIEIYTLDLASFDGICSFVSAFLAKHAVLDALVNNAGAYPASQRFTEDGFELMFGGNTLGPILLTQLLLPALEAAEDGRIVHVSSMLHLLGNIDFNSFRGRKPYFAMAAYAQSKLGNLLYSNALAARTRVKSNAIHPGGVGSPLYRELPKPVYAGIKLFLIGPEPAAKLVADLAFSAKHRGVTGQYFTAQPPRFSSGRSQDIELQDRFYTTCCELAGVTASAKIH